MHTCTNREYFQSAERFLTLDTDVDPILTGLSNKCQPKLNTSLTKLQKYPIILFKVNPNTETGSEIGELRVNWSPDKTMLLLSAITLVVIS